MTRAASLFAVFSLFFVAGCSPGSAGTTTRRDSGMRPMMGSDAGPGGRDAGDLPPSYDCRTADDADGDTIPDRIEGATDTDLDGTDNSNDDDSDGDALLDSVEAGDGDPCTAPVDGNVDGIPDYLDADRDDDGLPDGAEAMHGTAVDDDDSDDDGFVDGIEVLAGTSPTDPASVIPPEDFYVILPYMDPAQTRELSFRARLGQADVFFLVDTTGSMGGAIANVSSSLSTTIVPAIRDVIADGLMGVGDFRDFPRSPYGDAGDWTFTLKQALTDSVPAVQAALGTLRAGGGADYPESMVEALYRTVNDGCAGGAGFGAACFRMTATPIVVVVTDAPTHNGPGGSNPYSGMTARSHSETATSVRARGVKVLGVNVGSFGFPGGARPDLEAMARDTMSFGASGGVLVYDAPSGSVDGAVVDGIGELAGGIPQDVTTEKEDDPADTTDATRFMTAVRPVRSSSPSVTMDDTTFFGVPGGAQVTFEVTFENTFVPHMARPQLFRAHLHVINADTRDRLDSRDVYVIVPAEGGGIVLE